MVTRITKKKKASTKKSTRVKRAVVKQRTRNERTASKKKKQVAKRYLPEVAGIVLSDAEQKLLQQHQSLKLQIELVPESCWWSNVKSNVAQSVWDRIRFTIYQRANSVCEICGGIGTKHPVECHEVWVYDESTKTQRLSHFQSICPLCHEVKHIGLAEVLGNGERAFKRFRTINGLNKSTADKIRSAVWKQWGMRSKQHWKLDIEHLRAWGLNPDQLKNKSERRVSAI